MAKHKFQTHISANSQTQSPKHNSKTTTRNKSNKQKQQRVTHSSTTHTDLAGQHNWAVSQFCTGYNIFVQSNTISDKSFVQSKPFLDKAWMIITTFWKNCSDKGDDHSSNKLRAHRLVLGAASPFLKAVFSDIPQVRSQHSNLFTVCFCYHEKLLPSASGSQLFATAGRKKNVKKRT